MTSTNGYHIKKFNLGPGTRLAGKYEVLESLGGGWEGEVYLVRERRTGIERAAKMFYPRRNQRNKTVRFYARKLHKLRHCPILIQYHTQECIDFEGFPVIVLVSDYVEGELLSNMIKRQPGKRFTPFEGLHILYALAKGVEKIHQAKEYHGDLHTENIIIQRQGLGFRVRLVDMYNWGAPNGDNIRDDVVELVRIFYEAIGGPKQYAKQPQYVKDIVCGMKRSLITRKFRNAGHLRRYLETFEWD